jgi:hypothetical protein
MMMRFLLLIAAASLPSLAAAQPQTQSTPQPAAQPKATATPPGAGPNADEVKVNQLIVYGSDECPKSTTDQITVCARLPDAERYRIPPDLRDLPNTALRESWTRKVERLEMVGLTGTGSCSAVGQGAAAGCLGQLIRQAGEERGMSPFNWTQLVEKARKERLGRIDSESEQIDRDLQKQAP